MGERAVLSLLREHAAGIEATWIADRLATSIHSTTVYLERLATKGVAIEIDGLWYPTDGAYA